MKYDLSNSVSKSKFKFRQERLIERGAMVELKEVRPCRSNQQNRYLHLILSYFAMEYGETVDYVKSYFFKTVVNNEIFVSEYHNKKKDYRRDEVRSTSDLDSKELTIAIDRFRDYSAKEAQIYLPAPNEEEYLKSIEVEVAQYKNYL